MEFFCQDLMQTIAQQNPGFYIGDLFTWFSPKFFL